VIWLWALLIVIGIAMVVVAVWPSRRRPDEAADTQDESGA
jgi:hypothetical protein